MTTCPHCGEVVKKGNFCNKCGKKLSKICDCWLMKRPYHCSFQKCPDMSDFTLLLLHIQQDQKRRQYVFLKPILEAIDMVRRKGVQKDDNDKSKNDYCKHERNKKHRYRYRKYRSKLMRTHKPAPRGRLLSR